MAIRKFSVEGLGYEDVRLAHNVAAPRGPRDVHVYIYIYIYVHTCIYKNHKDILGVSMYIYICVYIYI